MMNIFSRRPHRYERVSEGQTNWGRGMLILASMAGVFLIFFVVLSLLQYGTHEAAEIRGLATVATDSVRAAPAPAATAPPATAVAAGSPTGVTALVREAPYVRSGPGIDYQIVTNLQNGQTVDVIGRTIDGSWLQVILPNGVRGWSSRNFLTITGNLNNVPVTQ